MNLAHTYATSLITCLSNVFTICILRTTDIIRIFRPYQALYLSLSWLEQSIVGNDIVALIVLNLQCNGISIVPSLGISNLVLGWSWIQLVRMSNLQTYSQNSIVSDIKQCCTCIVLFWRSNTEVIGCCTCIKNCWVKNVESINISICQLSIYWVCMIVNSPSWTIHESLVVILVVNTKVLYGYTIMVCASTCNILLLQASTIQVWIFNHLNTVEVELRHEYQACQVTRQ